MDLQVAIRNNQLGVAYFNDTLPLPAILVEDGKIEGSVFVGSWKSLPEANEVTQQLPINIGSLDSVRARLAAANLFVMAHKQVRAYLQAQSSSCGFVCNKEVFVRPNSMAATTLIRAVNPNQHVDRLLVVRLSKGCVLPATMGCCQSVAICHGPHRRACHAASA